MPPPNENVANPIFWSIFIKITSLEPFLTVLYFAPTFLWLLTVLCLFTIIKRIFNSYRAFVGTFFFSAFFFELFFANRYAYTSPLFVLFVGLLIESFRQPSRSFRMPLLLLAPAITIAHVGHSTMILVVTVTFASLLTWYKFRGNLVNDHARTHAWNIALLLFVFYGFWYFVQEIRFYGIKLWFNAFIDVLHRGFFELRLIEAVYKLPLEPIYELTVMARIVATLISTIIPTLLAIFYVLRSMHARMDADKIIRVGAAVCFVLFLIPLGVGVVEGIWSLRPLNLSMLFSPILIALLLQRKLFKPLVIATTLFSLIIAYILWIPNLGYIQVPDEKVELIKFVSVYIPQHQTIGTIGTTEVEQTLLTHIFSNRADLSLRSISDPCSDKYKTVTENTSFVMIDPSIEVYEVKYVIEPGILERVHLTRNVLVEGECYNIVYDSSTLYSLLYKK
jgi:hypothetical protein